MNKIYINYLESKNISYKMININNNEEYILKEKETVLKNKNIPFKEKIRKGNIYILLDKKKINNS